MEGDCILSSWRYVIDQRLHAASNKKLPKCGRCSPGTKFTNHSTVNLRYSASMQHLLQFQTHQKQNIYIYIIIIHYESSLFSRVQFPNFSRCFTMKSPPWLPIRTAFLGASIPGPAPAGERTNNGWEVHRGFILFGGFLNHGTNPQIIQT